MELRLLNQQDAEQFQQVRLRALRDHPESFGMAAEEEQSMTLDQVAGLLAPHPQRFTVGAFEAGNLVGFAGFYQMARLKMRHKGHIWGMYVAPEGRGKGVGRGLLEDIIQRARTLDGIEEVVLAVTVGNDYARHIYIAAGFDPYCIEPRLIRVGKKDYDVEWMCLLLK
jgi:ribosomal protein S18 acetylase RimI-like enzyme